MATIKTKIIDGLKFNHKSKNPDDYVEILNYISANLGRVSNLGVFADIVSISHKDEIVATLKDSFMNIRTFDNETPNITISNMRNIMKPDELDVIELTGEQLIDGKTTKLIK